MDSEQTTAGQTTTAEQAAKPLPKRGEIDEKYKWRLEDIYPDTSRWESDYQRVEGLARTLESYRGKLQESAKDLLECLRLRDEIMQLEERIYSYSRLRRDEDTANPVHQGRHDRSDRLLVKVDAAVSFIAPEILSIPEELLGQFVRQEEGLALYRHFLDEIIRRRPHTLSATEERLLARAGEMAQAPETIFTMLDDADITFPSIRDAGGEIVELTRGRYLSIIQSPDRRVRKDAFEALYSGYGRLKNTFGATLNASVKKDLFAAEVRKYDSALEAAMSEDDVPVAVYTNLIDTVHRRLDLMHRYMALRKKMLGLDTLHMYDVYVPLVKEVEMKIPFEEAVEIVGKALGPLGGEYQEVLRKGMTSRWIDVFETRAKAGGAYSNGVYGVHPFVLLNYEPDLMNVFTLAHEMGHALHSYYSFANQPYVYAHYTIFTAEVASTLNEALLTHYLLGTTPDRAQRMYLVNNYLERFRVTLYRQVMFAEFEKIIHEKVEAGGALTPDEFSRTYRDLNAAYHGPETVADDEIALEWARIPHFYMTFYVYKYATGFSAATALSKQILEEGRPAVDRYLAFLKSGGSDYPVNLLKKAGVDMTSPEPIEDALRLFESLLDEMEELGRVR
ncbi:MAG: oligoendopeptidase F [Firmicutes bacterium]|nr:oligoendopeptidase F [Bacillota bacterium]